MKIVKNKILVAIDFEEQSLSALEQSFHLAEIFKAELLLLYVIEPFGGISKHFFPDDYVNKIVANVREKFEELQMLAKKTEADSKIPVSSIIVKGKPYEKIIEVAKDYGVIMIVMGKNGIDTSRKSKYIGSNTFNVIREAHCPVISMKGGKLSKEFNNILLPLDLSKSVDKQVDAAISIGFYFGALINVFAVFTKESKAFKILKQVKIMQLKNRILKSGLNCIVKTITAPKSKKISSLILEHSKEINADLLVIITQQKKVFAECFVGSNAQEIINDSQVPVLSLIPEASFNPGVVSSFIDPLGLMKKENKK